MNAKQRRQKRRKDLKLATTMVEIIESLLDDIEGGENPISFHREQLNDLKTEIQKQL